MFRRNFIIAALSTLFALAGLACLTPEDLQAAGGGAQPRLEGTLVSVAPATSTVMIRVQGGAVRTLVIPSTAKVERNGIKVTLRAFKVGDRVQARFTADGLTVIKFEGTGL